MLLAGMAACAPKKNRDLAVLASNVKRGMTVSDVIAKLGEPDDDTSKDPANRGSVARILAYRNGVDVLTITIRNGVVTRFDHIVPPEQE
ncbi:MAG: hypothetical protein ABL962_20260 [Fimbriimonadaceae bacterium]